MKRYILGIVALVSLISFLPAQNRFYVSQAATGQNNGTSWPDAFTDLQDAIQASESGDTIWVAAGTYKPTNGTTRTISFEPKSGVRMYGGFEGTEVQIDARNWLLNKTILSGDIGVALDSTDNSFSVVYLAEPDSNTVIDGFTICFGNANTTASIGSRDRGGCGGGMYIMGEGDDAYATVRNCHFLHNTAMFSGGGLMINAGSLGSVAPTIQDCLFEYNTARSNGGGVARYGSSWVERMDFERCTFQYNWANTNGGGFYFSEAARTDYIDLKDCIFFKNRVVLNGAAAFLLCGRTQGGKNRVLCCKFIENIGPRTAGLIIRPSNEIIYSVVDSCLFENNNPLSGTAQPVDLIFETTLTDLGVGSKYSLSNNTFQGDKFPVSTRCIEADVPKIQFSGNRFEDLNNRGNILSFRNIVVEGLVLMNLNNFDILINTNVLSNISNVLVDNATPKNLGYLFANSTTTTTTFSQFTFSNISVNNFSTDRFLFLQNTLNNSNISISNSIFFQSKVGVSTGSISNFPTVHFNNNAFDTYSFNNFTTENIILDSSNILQNINPLFVNPVAGDFRLQPCSPAINAGNNAYTQSTTDLAGNPRILGGTVDMGAYEFTGAVLTAAPTVSPACSALSNGSVSLQTDACAPLTYNWTGPQNTSGTNLTNLASGTYTLTITDSKGNTLTTTFTVGESTATASATSIPVACGTGLGGTAALENTSNLTPPLQYLWADAVTDSLRTDLPPGAYTLTVTDSRGCKASATATVGLEGELSVVLLSDPIYCFGDSTASIMATPQGGKEPFNWLWADGSNNIGISNLSAGTYTGTLTDAFGCKATWSIPISQPDSLSLSAQITPASNTQTANGSVSVAATGGSGIYLYQWSNGGMTASISGLLPGFYTLTLTDSNGCTRTATYEVKPLVGVLDPSSAVAVSAWPNPTPSWLYLDVPDGTLYEAQLTDGQGRIIGQVRAARYVTAWDLRVQPAGVYYWRVKAGAGVERVGRVVKE